MERAHHVHTGIGMNQKVRMLGLLAAIAVSSSSIGAVVDTDMPLSVWWNGSPPTPDGRTWVNVLFRDFNGAGPLGNYEWIRDTVELQITTDSLTHGLKAPVVGRGSLLSGEDVKSLWLKFNPNKDISKLKIYWTGASMAPGVPTNADTFPDAGLQPSDISLGANFDKAGPMASSISSSNGRTVRTSSAPRTRTLRSRSCCSCTTTASAKSTRPTFSSAVRRTKAASSDHSTPSRISATSRRPARTADGSPPCRSLRRMRCSASDSSQWRWRLDASGLGLQSSVGKAEPPRVERAALHGGQGLRTAIRHWPRGAKGTALPQRA
jgi:hypothetical protein